MEDKINQTMDAVTDDKNLYRAYKKSMSGRSYTQAGKKFAADPLPRLYRLQQQLRGQTYKVDGYTSFVVTEPKRREILACHFADKVAQHALCDRILSPMLPDVCIQDSYAGQQGKGSKYARDRLQAQLRDFTSRYSDGYAYKGDIHKFYYSINHEVAKQVMHKHFPPDTWWMIDAFVDSTPGVGIALGNQINTIVSNMYLGELDRYIKQDLGVTWYGRYADDFFILCPDRDELKGVVQNVDKFLQCELHLQLNPKSQIMPIKNGMKFIGFHFYAAAGRTWVKLINEKRRAHRRKFNRMVKLVRAGKIPLQALEVSQQCWEAHASYATDFDPGYYHCKLKELRKECTMCPRENRP